MHLFHQPMQNIDSAVPGSSGSFKRPDVSRPARGRSFLNDIAQNITNLCLDDLDTPPAIVGAQNWSTPPFEFDEFYSPSKEWFFDASHERIVPLPNCVPTTSITDVEKVHRLKAGV